MLCLMALFLCDIVLLGLLVALQLGGYRFLVRLVVWLLLILMLLVNVGVEVFALRVPLVSKSSPVRKRFRLNRKTPAHLVGVSLLILVHVYGRDCVRWSFQDFPCLITQGGVVIMLMGALFMSMTELGSGDFPGLCAGPRFQVCTPFNQLSLACTSVVMWIYTHS